MDNQNPLQMPGVGFNEYLTPEMAQRLANIAYIPEEHGGLQQQLEQAIALRSRQMPNRTSAQAATYDGIGHLARQIGSFAQEQDLRKQQGALRGQQKNGYGEFLKQLFQAQALRGEFPQQPPQAQQQAAPPAFTPMDLSQA